MAATAHHPIHPIAWLQPIVCLVRDPVRELESKTCPLRRVIDDVAFEPLGPCQCCYAQRHAARLEQAWLQTLT